MCIYIYIYVGDAGGSPATTTTTTNNNNHHDNNNNNNNSNDNHHQDVDNKTQADPPTQDAGGLTY